MEKSEKSARSRPAPLASSSSGTVTWSRANCACWPAVPQPKSGALPVAAEARILVVYCSSGITSMRIWTSLWASLKFLIIWAQTSPSEAASQLQCTISVGPEAANGRAGLKNGLAAAIAVVAAAPLTKRRRPIGGRITIVILLCCGPCCSLLLSGERPVSARQPAAGCLGEQVNGLRIDPHRQRVAGGRQDP